MPLAEKSKIIVLHLTKYSDSSVIIHAVDSKYGRRSFLLRGIKGSRRSITDFHPLNVIDVVSSTGAKSTLAYLKEWTPVMSLEGIRSDIYKSTVAMFISEVIYRSLTSEFTDDLLFDSLCNSVSRLESHKGSVANFHLWWLAFYCSNMGFQPADTIEPSGIFDRDDAELFLTILRTPFDECMNLPLSSKRRVSFSRKMLNYLSYHLSQNINIRSLDVLHEIFA